MGELGLLGVAVGDVVAAAAGAPELYLNVAQWGEGVFGAQAAARHYFKVDAARLSAMQAARLAGMLPNPAYYDKNRNSPYLQSRTRTISQRMRQVAIP